MIQGIRHALLAHVHRVQHRGSSQEALSRFYYHFNDYLSLVMWKVRDDSAIPNCEKPVE